MELAELIKQWTASGDINGSHREYAQPEGFCKAACQYWISEMARWTSDRDIMNAIEANDATISVRQATIRGRGESIPGMRVNAVSTRNFFGLGDLRSRDRLMDEVLERDGLYIFGAGTSIRGGAGHAVAFSRRNGEFRFFDPNSGTYSARGLTGDRKRMIRTWFKEYWGKIYKDDFHNGPRSLVRYEIEDFTALLDLGADPFIYVLAAFL